MNDMNDAIPSKKSLVMRMTREVLRVLKLSWRPLLLFELVYKLLTIGIFIPLMSALFNQILDWGGYQAIANHDVIRFLFSRHGMVSLIVLAPIAIAIIYTEFAVLVYIAYYSIQGREVRVRAVLMKVLVRLPQLGRIGLLGLAIYLLLLFPLLDAGFGASLLPSLFIPEFITSELMKTLAGLLAVVGFGAFIIAMNLICIYALPILVLERAQRFVQVVRKSARLFWRSKFTLLALLAEWLLVAILIVVFFFILLVLFLVLTIWILGESIAIDMALGMMMSLGLYTLSLLLTPLFVIAITRVYMEYTEPSDYAADEDGIDPTYWICEKGKKQQVKKQGGKLVTMIMLLCIAFGWGLTMLFASEQPAQRDEFILMAHRGDVSSGIENTMEAFEGAVQAGADRIELDIMQTKDGKLVVFHDENLKRLTGHDIPIYDITWEELQKLSLHDNGLTSRISTLDEVISTFKGKTKFTIDLKPHGFEQDLVASLVNTIHKHGIQDEVYVQSTDYEFLQEFRAAAPKIKIGYVMFAAFRSLHPYDVDYFAIEQSFISSRIIASAKLLNKPLYVWTVNDVDSAEHFYKLGVDGVITDITADIREHIDLLH
ncbi:glycerophosphodiester phosphodiesterase [Paenibacillus agilis]|uniref:Glycerophosphodiester phosphodiesterase n=2 Tax=Paenibacillus agilis TaxID=3020863 RepID=A0A559IVQ7_9BACL|nr:glycerophosphodiester phosphodiesterase [Paenibacillus agilis]